MKKCIKCGKDKELKEYHAYNRSPDGKRARCKVCRSEDNAVYYYENGGQEHKLAYDKEWYKRYKPIRLAQQKKNYADWIAFFKREFGEHPVCEIDGEPLVWTGDKNRLVHFDHRHGNDHQITRGVYHWMRGNPLNERNIERFHNERFGILCGYCNASLPTNLNRRKAIAKYIMESGDE